jgi:uncharacterized repeat protein (TIGR03803 family)
MGLARVLVAMFVLSGIVLFQPETSQAQTFTDILDFTGSSFADPGVVTLAQARNGNLYGTTSAQPITGLGTIFGITPTGTIVLEFGGFDYTNGAFPAGGVTLATDGTLYGTTEFSSYNADSSGVIYTITTGGGAYTALHQFEGGDGSFPIAPPIEGSDGNFYGTTNGLLHGLPSTIYQYVPQTQTLNSLHQFGKEIGLYYALTQGVDGDLYGVANAGGPNKFGCIFRLSTSGVLRYSYNFTGGAGGTSPSGPLVQLSDGNFYGTVADGGAGSAGFVFKMTPAGMVSTVYNFTGVSGETSLPTTGLTLGSDGQLYGASALGGASGTGTLYRITPGGQYTLLYSFPSFAGTAASLVQHTNGKFYGVTANGGADNFGMVYSLDVGSPEFITLVQSQGRPGQNAQILGQGLNGTTNVTFNGVAAAFVIHSDTYVAALIPNGATSGPVVVTTRTGTLKSVKNFRISN